MPTRRGFDIQALALLSQALEVAEEQVSEHFQLSGASWSRYPYEVRTLAELMPREVSRQALAQVLKLRRPPLAGGSLRAKDFFRICLQDHNLLSLIRREGNAGLLLPLLTYVLAHELVHVVRFYRHEHLFEAEARERAAEEMRVHEITCKILQRTPLPRLAEVINLYAVHRAGLSGPGWCCATEDDNAHL
jgi:hypothetical protein